MRRKTTTKPSMALSEGREKGADADLLREMIEYVAQRMMEMDDQVVCDGTPKPGSANSRNGYRDRSWTPAPGVSI